MSNTPPLDFLINDIYQHACQILKHGNELSGNFVSFFNDKTEMKIMTAIDKNLAQITGQPNSYDVLKKVATGINAKAFSIAIPLEITDSSNKTKEAIVLYASKRDQNNKLQSESCVFYIERGRLERIKNISSLQKFTQNLPKGVKDILSQNPPKKSEIMEATAFLKQNLNMDISKANNDIEEPEFSRNIEDIKNLPDWVK